GHVGLDAGNLLHRAAARCGGQRPRAGLFGVATWGGGGGRRGFAALLAQKLKPGGELQLATDWAPYAQHMLDVLDAAPQFRNVAADGRYVPRPSTRLKTRFEARGERLGHEVFDLAY
ncbi:UNVERIFIED_CONTAM: hypothetical protein IGO34_25755, partial [Salmonella enterica subsp. enterica serovar Weltevreden]